MYSAAGYHYERIDHLGYRQRPLFRLAYRNFGDSRIAGHQSIGVCRHRAKRRSVRHSLVGTAQSQQQPRHFPARHLCAWAYGWDSSLDGKHRHEFTWRHCPGLTAPRTARTHQCFPACFTPPATHGDPPGQMTLGEGSIKDGTGSQTGAATAGAITRQSTSIRPMTRLSGTSTSTFPRQAPSDGDCESARLILVAE